MTPRPPTAQGISRLLAAAGFTRSEHSNPSGDSTGFKASKDLARDKAVRVRHTFGGVPPRNLGEQARGKLAEYAEAIRAAGWTVDAGEYELTVTAGKADR